jgi:eukaryotic-like serine/threonine-protein kinase
MGNSGSSVLRFGAFEADLATGELRKNGHPVKLQPQPFKLLALLLERQGDLVTREDIRRTLWAGTKVDFDAGLNFAVKKIRDALGDDADRPEYIETLAKRGYRFIATVERPKGMHGPREGLAPEGRVTSIASGRVPSGIVPRAEGSGALALTEVPELGVAGTGDGDAPSEAVSASVSTPEKQGHSTRTTSWRWWTPAVAAIIALAGCVTYLHFRFQRVPKLTEQDTVVLADFTNTTGDPVFDLTLRQGLSAQLEQSPFLNLLSDTRITQTLALMDQPRDARLTRELAREVCQRTGGAATIEGSIAGLGDRYVVGLQVANCRTGDLLANEQVTVNGKENVLGALGHAATKLRQHLGEALTSVQKYDVPPEDVTTGSLQALQAYSLGLKAFIAKFDFAGSIPLFQQAISQDPNFAMAYARLGTSYRSLGEKVRAAENVRKAYELRDRVSQREEFYIASHYDTFVTGDLEAARKTCELWAATYPRDVTPPNNLGFIYQVLGEYPRALAAYQDVLKLDPGSGLNYSNLLAVYVLLNRLDEAKATVQEAHTHKVDAPIFHIFRYMIDFLQHDRTGMQSEADALIGKPGFEDVILFDEADTAAYNGQFVSARALTRRGVDSAQRAGEKELGASYEAEAALREVLIGNRSLARQQVQAALALSDGRDVEGVSAVALGLAGDSTEALRLANDLDKRFPNATVVQFRYLPMIRAATILGSGKTATDAARSVEWLAKAAPYELGTLGQTLNIALCPVYLRGEAYLAAHQGVAAAAEFQKILDYPGVVLNEPIGALAHLGLGRAYAVEAGLSRQEPSASRHARNGGVNPPLPTEALAKARISYQDFLALWRDADPGIPILKQAKAEYARLQSLPNM